MISFSEGMATLPLAIEKRWRSRILTNTTVEQIEQGERRWRVRSGDRAYEADRLIIATNAGVASRLVRQTAPAVAAALQRIEYPPVAIAVSVYDRSAVDHPLDGFGVLLPEVERRTILGIIFSSTLFPNRAPEGMVALTSFIGGARQPELALRRRDQIERDVYREHRELLGAHTPPRSFNLTLWEHAIPQYNLGYQEILDEIKRSEQSLPGLHFLGNYRGGVSVGDCVKGGRGILDL